ncbi:hypothetical protein NECAME_14233 [Necator americanus]|uniref:Uncharacterized protein n=1 Tax=Necator americanus TaxID=51031 RepID=W2SRD7_NECAM|nr:hypothetical protein NECAME_14233 [Necator americanus]ETN71421.1 hypothetical protein NECAME_14233 [Necator americanus]
MRSNMRRRISRTFTFSPLNTHTHPEEVSAKQHRDGKLDSRANQFRDRLSATDTGEIEKGFDDFRLGTKRECALRVDESRAKKARKSTHLEEYYEPVTKDQDVVSLVMDGSCYYDVEPENFVQMQRFFPKKPDDVQG